MHNTTTMARPKNKQELIELSTKNFQKLNNLIDSYNEKERVKEFPKGTMNRNIKDVLAHLHHWHLMMLNWYEVGMKGQKPLMPAEGYTWKTVPELNYKIWKKYKSNNLAPVRKELKKSFLELQKVIKQHSDNELFEKKRYKWTGTTSLGAYLISATSSHYDWGYKLIKKNMK